MNHSTQIMGTSDALVGTVFRANLLELAPKVDGAPCPSPKAPPVDPPNPNPPAAGAAVPKPPAAAGAGAGAEVLFLTPAW